MHVMSLPDVVMNLADLDADDRAIIEIIRYLCRGEKPLGDGHVIADENGPRFHAATAPGLEMHADSPAHNPFGRLKLVSIKDIAERN